MSDSLFRRALRSHNFSSHLGVACGLGLLLGIAFLRFTPLWTLAALISGGLISATLKRPELLPLAFLVLTSSVIRVSKALSFSIGFGTLYLTDVVFLLSVGLIIVRWMVKADFKMVRTPLDWPLLIFWGASLISTFIAIIASSLPWKQSLHEIRVVTSYLMFFVVTNLVRDKRQLILIIRGLLLLATIVALAMVVQCLLGQSRVILAGRVENLGLEGQALAGVARIIPPGQSIIMVAFTAVFATLVMERANVLRYFQCGLLGLAIILTFFRASWVVTGLTMLLVGLLARGQEIRRLIVWGLAAILSVTIILMAIMQQPESRGAKLASAAFERLFTLTQSKTFEDPHSSLRWRDFEYSYALPHILSNPFVGLGLGAKYRPLTAKDHEDFDGRAFIHNGHVWILLKSGVFGYFGLLWFSLAFLLRGFRYWRCISEPHMRGIVLAFTLTYLGVLIVSMVEPYVMLWSWTPVIGIIAGINEVALQKANQESSLC